MNKQFVIKMLQAKQLEYQALKELLPNSMAKRVKKLETEIIDLGKEYFMTVLKKEESGGTSSSSEASTKVRKVTIE